MFSYHQLVVFCAASVILIGCSREAKEFSEPELRPAKLIEVETATTDLHLTFPAVIQATKSAELTFQVSGEILELNVLQGAAIQQGDVIAKLDQRNAINAVEQARVEYENASSEYQRYQQLIAQSLVSQSNLDAQRTKRDVAAIALSNAEKALSDTELHAPFSGAISQLYVNQYQNIQAKEPIVVIQSQKREAIINVPGTIVAITPQFEPANTRVVLDQAPNAEIPAEFREFSGIADQATQTYEVSFSFLPPEELLILPGMTANVSTTLIMNSAGEQASGVSLPIAAILAEGENTYVWVVDSSDMSIGKRLVQVETVPGESIRVIDGLEDGETIVAAGVSFFHEGMKVRAWTPE